MHVWKAAPCLTVRGLSREQHWSLSQLAAARQMSREGFVRELLLQTLEEQGPATDLLDPVGTVSQIPLPPIDQS